ncbi:hypothetical protein [Actinoplanes sp. NPDC026623]|uniref:hypothetical protein n=1 Tax=Actinoplanes sp. NPDC026623 TaxID=3155610 RepID=UPI00340B19FC
MTAFKQVPVDVRLTFHAALMHMNGPVMQTTMEVARWCSPPSTGDRDGSRRRPRAADVNVRRAVRGDPVFLEIVQEIQEHREPAESGGVPPSRDEQIRAQRVGRHQHDREHHPGPSPIQGHSSPSVENTRATFQHGGRPPPVIR